MLDGLLILLGVLVIILCTMDGFLRAIVTLVSFYLITTATGMLTLATDMLRGVAGALADVGGGRTPSMTMTQTIIFAVLTVLLFIASYFAGKALFRDTTIPKLQVLDNILGAIVGIVLVMMMAAVIYNTWGVAISVRWQNVQAWNAMRVAYFGSSLRPYLREILVTLRPLFFTFSYLEYPPFFQLQA
jgi:Zn-dependent protease with chaperone function